MQMVTIDQYTALGNWLLSAILSSTGNAKVHNPKQNIPIPQNVVSDDIDSGHIVSDTSPWGKES